MKYSQNQLSKFTQFMKDVSQLENPLNVEFYKKGNKIQIKKKNKGKFTESANRAGMGVQEFASHVLANKDKYSTTLIKRANFARNSKTWKHKRGGVLFKFQQGGTPEGIRKGVKPEDLMKEVDKEHPDYARIRDNDLAKPLEGVYPEFALISGARQLQIQALKEAFKPIRAALFHKPNLSKEYPDVKSGVKEYLRQLFNLINPIF